MVIKCTISGSFRFYEQILTTIEIFENSDIQVLSPKKSEVTDQKDGFIFLKSDDIRDVKTLENRHLQAIAGSHFLYIYNPKGHMGRSVCLEIGYAIGRKKPIFSLERVLSGNL